MKGNSQKIIPENFPELVKISNLEILTISKKDKQKSIQAPCNEHFRVPKEINPLNKSEKEKDSTNQTE